MKSTHPPLYAVGSVVKAFGIKGEIVVQHMTDSPDRFRSLRSVWVGDDSQSATEVRIEHCTVESRGVRIKLRGTDDRTAAEALRGKVFFVDERHRVRLPAGRYFVHDVIGLAVLDEQGHALGHVADVLHAPAHDLYVVRGNGSEFMIPAVREFIAAIDLEHRTMTVRLIEGLVE